jgi:membrane protease YdiL (CAAX protease family)
MWARDFGVAMTFWLMAMVLLAALATLLRLMHQMPLQKAVLDLAPQGALQIVTWLMLCITAGIVEEFVFRGYLLQQFSSIGSSNKGRLWLGVLVSSLLFGSAHGYEGLGGMIAITAYGAMFCILTIKRKSLRPGMMAHAWHDSLTGIALAIARHLRAI